MMAVRLYSWQVLVSVGYRSLVYSPADCISIVTLHAISTRLSIPWCLFSFEIILRNNQTRYKAVQYRYSTFVASAAERDTIL